jgi:hypothetical protein
VVGFRLHPALVVVLAVAICGGLVLGIGWLRTRRLSTTEALMAHLPPEEAVILAVNLASLRQSGILSAMTASKITEEPEYRAFVQETGFDYQQDIDLILAWFRQETTYVLLRGRFDWARLRAYVTAQGGVCRNTFCNLEGSTPQRKISFFPLNRDVMALAVSPSEGAAWALKSARPGRPGRSVPDHPAWLLVPVSALRDAENLPAGTRLLAKAVASADKVQLSLAAPGGRLEVLLEAACRSAEDASTLSSQLESATRLLKETIAREKQTPNPGDLSGVLAAGSFRSEGQRVLGRWPVERAFLESILGGAQ